jgi:hypothetical protein
MFLRVGGLGALTLAAMLSWGSRPTAIVGGAGVVALTVLAARAFPPRALPVLVAVAYPYALVLVATASSWAGLAPTPVWCVTGVVALCFAGALTMTRWPTTPAWGVVTGWSAIVGGVAIATTGLDRSWWSAGASAAMMLFALIVTEVRRRAIAPAIRALAAFAIVPAASVALINAGAMIIPGSASPILLPVVTAVAAVAAVAAVSLPSLSLTHAVHLSAALTAVIALILALTLDATGATTVLVVCALISAGGAVAAALPGGTWLGWIACSLGAAGVLWSALVLGEVGLVEAYTAPPALAAVVVGYVVVRRRGRRWRALPVGGAVLGLAPSLLALTMGEGLIGRAIALSVVAAAALWIERSRADA